MKPQTALTTGLALAGTALSVPIQPPSSESKELSTSTPANQQSLQPSPQISEVMAPLANTMANIFNDKKTKEQFITIDQPTEKEEDSEELEKRKLTEQEEEYVMKTVGAQLVPSCVIM